MGVKPEHKTLKTRHKPATGDTGDTKPFKYDADARFYGGFESRHRHKNAPDSDHESGALFSRIYAIFRYFEASIFLTVESSQMSQNATRCDTNVTRKSDPPDRLGIKLNDLSVIGVSFDRMGVDGLHDPVGRPAAATLHR